MKQLIALIMVSGSLLAQSQSKPHLRGHQGHGHRSEWSPCFRRHRLCDRARPGAQRRDAANGQDRRQRGVRFSQRLELGTYELYSRKDAEGYPDPQDSFYADAKTETPRVDLTSDHPSATVTLKLGPQAAVVTGRIVDANTGSAVKAILAFEDGDGHGHSVSVDGNYRIIVPSGKKVTLMVTLVEPANRSLLPVAPLQLDPGQYVHMDIPISAQ